LHINSFQRGAEGKNISLNNSIKSDFHKSDLFHPDQPSVIIKEHVINEYPIEMRGGARSEEVRDIDNPTDQISLLSQIEKVVINLSN